MSLFERLAPALHLVEPERAHRLSIAAAKAGLHPRFAAADPALAVEMAGLAFANPLGLAAGYDKGAEVPGAMWGAGFGHVEVGTVTPLPQPGNARPRVFRLSEDRAVVNRYGFNSEGARMVRARLDGLARRGILGVNVGANKHNVADASADYVAGVETFGSIADYLTLNVSSPNTAGLRDLQGGPLADLVARVMAAAGRLPAPPPVFLKIAPDLDAAQMDAIARVVEGSGLAALIVSNTTVARDGLASRHASQAGGLSGRPLFAPSTRLLAAMRLRLPDTPLVGVGGVEDAATAWRKIEAGASLVQLYTAMVYRGTGVAREIVEGLSARCASEGVAIRDVVGREAQAIAGAKV